jgi:hypothetical protein
MDSTAVFPDRQAGAIQSAILPPPTRRAVVGDLIISTITPDGNGGFAVTIRIGDGEPQPVRATARDLETFTAFRRLVCSQCGCWSRHDAEQGGRRGREAWLDEIETAFHTGRAER